MNYRNRMGPYSFIGGLLGFALAGISPSAQGVGPGDEAPPITVEHLSNAPDGVSTSTLDLSDLPHDTALIEFWGTWCAPCVEAIPHLNNLHDRFSNEMSFLSVTYEEPKVVERFLDVKPMKSWIGCDTDRSMVEAYDIAAWPTTFIVRNGMIVARTRPTALKVDRVRQWLDGNVESPVAEKSARNARVSETAAAEGRPPVGRIRSGRDPFSKLDESPRLQLIIRDAGETSQWAGGGGSATLIGATPRQIISKLWDYPRYAIIGDDWLEEKRYDVIYTVPRSQRETYLEIIRELTAKALGFEITFSEKSLDGYALKAADGGITLPDGVSEGSGWSVRGDNEGNVSVTSTSMSLGTLADVLAPRLEAPVVNETGTEAHYFIEITANVNDIDKLRAKLRKECGLMLVEAEVPTEVAVVAQVADPERVEQ